MLKFIFSAGLREATHARLLGRGRRLERAVEDRTSCARGSALRLPGAGFPVTGSLSPDYPQTRSQGKLQSQTASPTVQLTFSGTRR